MLTRGAHEGVPHLSLLRGEMPARLVPPRAARRASRHRPPVLFAPPLLSPPPAAGLTPPPNAPAAAAAASAPHLFSLSLPERKEPSCPRLPAARCLQMPVRRLRPAAAAAGPILDEAGAYRGPSERSKPRLLSLSLEKEKPKKLNHHLSLLFPALLLLIRPRNP